MLTYRNLSFLIAAILRFHLVLHEILALNFFEYCRKRHFSHIAHHAIIIDNPYSIAAIQKELLLYNKSEFKKEKNQYKRERKL